MRRLVEAARPQVVYVAHMRKVDAPGEAADDIGDVVVGVGAERTGAQRHAVVHIIHRSHEPQQLCLRARKARQAKDRPRRVVRMDGHPDVVPVARGHDRLEEIAQVFKERILIHAAVEPEQLRDVRHALRLPPRQQIAV